MVVDTISPSPSTPTTASSTNVILPPVIPAPSAYLDSGNLAILLGGIVVIFIIVKNALELVKGVYEFLDRRKKREQDLDAPLEARIRAIEETAKSFRAGGDIDRDIHALSNRLDHEKANRQTVQEGFNAKLINLSEAQQQDRLDRTRLEQKVESLAANSEKVEASLEKLQERIDDRFDRLHAAIISTRGAND